MVGLLIMSQIAQVFERRQIERREHALTEWRKLGRRADDRKRLETARLVEWKRKFDAARRVNS